MLIASLHNYKERITPEMLKNWVSLCKNHEGNPIIKIVAFAHAFEDNFLVQSLQGKKIPRKFLF
jgi:3-dehydroquinate dehydratase